MKYKRVGLWTTRRGESEQITFTEKEQEMIDEEYQWLQDKFENGTLGYGDVLAIFRSFKRLVVEGKLPEDWYE